MTRSADAPRVLQELGRDHFGLALVALLLAKLFAFGIVVSQTNLLPAVKGHWVTVPGTVTIIFALGLLIVGRGRHLFLLGANLAATLLILIDLWYARPFKRPASLLTLLQTPNLDGLGPSILAVTRGWDLLWLADVVVFAVILALRPTRQPLPRRGRAAAAFAVTGLALFAVKPVSDLVEGAPIFSRYDLLEDLVNYNAIGFHLLDGLRSAGSSRHIALDAEQRRRVEAWFTRKPGAELDRAPDEESFGLGRGLNLVTIQLESFPGSVVHQRHRGEPITPFLDRLASQGLYFPEFYAQNVEGSTSDAEFIFFTSLLPVARGSTFFRYPQNSYVTLPRLLGERGYETAAFHGNRRSFWNRGQAYPALGVETFYDQESFTAPEQSEMGIADAAMLTQTAKRLDLLAQPFFAHVITIDAHLGEVTDSAEGLVAAMRRTDAAIEHFFSLLQASELATHTVVVLFGDHPPYIQRAVLAGRPELEWLRNNGRRVPLVIHGPGIPSRVVDTIGGHLDLYPTVASIMGIAPQRYRGCVMGKDLLSVNGGYVVLANRRHVGRGAPVPPDVLTHRREAYDIADLVIRSNYFADRWPRPSP